MSAEKMRKVIIGCKGHPDLKWEITQEAEEAGMSLSEYMETILENRHMQDDVKMLRFRLRQAIQDKDNVLFKLEEYEQRIDSIYKKHKGQSLSFREKDGTISKKTISHPVDMLDCILSSVKSQS